MYYAHSANSAGKPEPLEEHLRKTAVLAEIFASAFGEGNAGKLMGWYHDLGKESVLFQDVLKHSEHNVNHAAAGAWIAGRLDKQSARAIYGHHDGLVWFIGSDIDRSINEEGSQDTQKGKRFSVSGNAQYKELSNYYRTLTDIPKTRPALNKDADSFYKHLPEMLHTRMLLSCLLVSTSCIEAGVDLDFSKMYRALAPLEAIVQCAGRCNRNGRGSGERELFDELSGLSSQILFAIMHNTLFPIQWQQEQENQRNRRNRSWQSKTDMNLCSTFSASTEIQTAIPIWATLHEWIRGYARLHH